MHTNQSELKKHKPFLEEMFKKEVDAYCAYEHWAEEIQEDSILESALEEIMYDEYLHARFLRDYMIDHHIFDLPDTDEHEKRFWKIQKHMFYE